jgi:formate/nitrite transporter FocA (FNT family)
MMTGNMYVFFLVNVLSSFFLSFTIFFSFFYSTMTATSHQRHDTATAGRRSSTRTMTATPTPLLANAIWGGFFFSLSF